MNKGNNASSSASLSLDDDESSGGGAAISNKARRSSKRSAPAAGLHAASNNEDAPKLSCVISSAASSEAADSTKVDCANITTSTRRISLLSEDNFQATTFSGEISDFGLEQPPVTLPEDDILMLDYIDWACGITSSPPVAMPPGIYHHQYLPPYSASSSGGDLPLRLVCHLPCAQ